VDAFVELVARLHAVNVRFVLIGVAAANYYAASGATLFLTQDRDVFLPLDADNLSRAWQTCKETGLRIYSGDEELAEVSPSIATAVLNRRLLTSAIGPGGLEIDLALEMSGFRFDEIWLERRVFRVSGVEIPVARLRHIIESKRAAGREKDRLFLSTHADALRILLAREGEK
jgi:hypothetical protein